ncbi:hypothetical protein FO519_001703 [Halicephalobus sp. NKZ332]|nr:hypothetical protein FO519_001703 [Halicephalobus sp. NKZ332]
MLRLFYQVDHVLSRTIHTSSLRERVREPTVISETAADERALILKDYTRFCHQQRIADEKWLKKGILAQDNALKELKRLAPALYEAAIQLDDNLLPRTVHGPKLTPPLKTYVCPDGDYVDTTKSWT